uniref:Uncharacterized protein n=1 Tax=Anguilla anguilla TaxID=7936 RepID=A0A0E9XCG8_ANGAN
MVILTKKVKPFSVTCFNQDILNIRKAITVECLRNV